MLTDNVGIIMKYPTMDMVSGFAMDNIKETELSFGLIRDSIKSDLTKKKLMMR